MLDEMGSIMQLLPVIKYYQVLRFVLLLKLNFNIYTITFFSFHLGSLNLSISENCHLHSDSTFCFHFGFIYLFIPFSTRGLWESIAETRIYLFAYCSLLWWNSVWVNVGGSLLEFGTWEKFWECDFQSAKFCFCLI